MQIVSQLIIKLLHKKVGDDEFGNSYYESKAGKRFVVYKGIAEPSKVPMEWHVWLHYSSNIAPVKIDTHKHSWQKIHLPNLTGTRNAYSPKQTKIVKSPYQSWKPH